MNYYMRTPNKDVESELALSTLLIDQLVKVANIGIKLKISNFGVGNFPAHAESYENLAYLQFEKFLRSGNLSPISQVKEGSFIIRQYYLIDGNHSKMLTETYFVARHNFHELECSIVN
jgi:hypothetical protein